MPFINGNWGLRIRFVLTTEHRCQQRFLNQLFAVLLALLPPQSIEYAGFPVGIEADELNWVDTFGFREPV